jgi:hypothetical protein
MNCIEALQEHLEECYLCKLKSKIIEFEQLPESEKFNFDYYEKDKDLILYCEPCKIYKLL